LNDDIIGLIEESILFNCESRIEMNENAYYVAVGNGTECGMIRFLQAADIPAQDLIKRKMERILIKIPFSAIRKRSVTAILHPDHHDKVRIYVKGAPEIVLMKCNHTYNSSG
jgi:magnesium-transporting ATPase (P-type)